MFVANRTKHASNLKGIGAYIGSVNPNSNPDEPNLISIQVDDGFKMPWVRIHPKDLVAALKNHPGLTISYEEPKPKVAENLPVGAVIDWRRKISFVDPHVERVVKIDTDKWLIGSASYPTSDAYIQEHLDKPGTTYTIVNPKEK